MSKRELAQPWLSALRSTMAGHEVAGPLREAALAGKLAAWTTTLTRVVVTLADKQVLSVQEHFFVHEQVPTWALLVSYRDIVKPGEHGRAAAAEAQVDRRAEMSEEDRPLYDALRKWRNDRARRDGRPPYVMLTNRQMAEVARLRPATQEALQQVQGIGDAKAQQYGAELLAVVAKHAPGVHAETPPPATQGAGGP